MANNKSAKKRIGIHKRNRLTNRYYKTSVRTLTKVFFNYLEKYKMEQTSESKKKVKTTLSLVYCFLDKGTKKNVFHRNAAARKKARLASCSRISN